MRVDIMAEARSIARRINTTRERTDRAVFWRGDELLVLGVETRAFREATARSTSAVVGVYSPGQVTTMQIAEDLEAAWA